MTRQRAIKIGMKQTMLTTALKSFAVSPRATPMNANNMARKNIQQARSVIIPDHKKITIPAKFIVNPRVAQIVLNSNLLFV
ncbi:hypothetical protein VU06_00530 [Desulfobulbus sp. F3]|nr:hypothetical protein [Desulfobulbus sp. F3]